MNKNELEIAEALYRDHCCEKGYTSFYQLYIKRAFDIVICLILIPFFLILMLPICIAIKLEDHGPVFYHSTRIGRGFQKFDMLKFRSMKVNAPDIRNEDGSTFNSEHDPRMTKVGKFLRETSLDEMPQIFNVLTGKMSIIGPRPGDYESKDTYRDDEKDKMLIKPGITGFTQSFFRNSIGVREKRLFDAWYAHAVSFKVDLKISLKTVKNVLLRKNIYSR